MYKEKVNTYILKLLRVALNMVRIIKSAYEPSDQSAGAYPGSIALS